jgi:hypothetical protein
VQKLSGKFLEIIIGDHALQIAIIPGIFTTIVALLGEVGVLSGAHVSICAQSCTMEIVASPQAGFFYQMRTLVLFL